MSSSPHDPSRDEVNYYAAPRAEIGGEAPLAGDQSEAEAIRRRYLSHEASIRSIGSLHYLGAILGVIILAGLTVTFFQSPSGVANMTYPRGLMGVFAGLAALYAAVNYVLGRGLRRLQPWARYVDCALILLSLLSNLARLALLPPANQRMGLVGLMAIPAYILYLLVSSKGSMVFSREYREIVAATPQIKYRTSLLVKIVVGLFVAVILLAIFGGIVGALSAKP